jgi:anti-repressor protein
MNAIAIVLNQENMLGEMPTVDARNLWEALGSKQEFAHWIKNRIEYGGFVENVDFTTFDKFIKTGEGGAGKTFKEYALSLDMAKHLCMLERNEKGREARRYFIKVEEDYNSPERVIHRALKMSVEQIAKLESEKKALSAQIEAERPQVIFANAVSVSDDTILIGQLAKLLKGNSVEIGQNRLFERLRQDGYLIKQKGANYNMPTQRAMEMGLFKVKETAITHSDGHVSISKTVKVTGKGQVYFINKFLAEKSGTPLRVIA